MVFDGIVIGLIIGFIRAGLKNGIIALSSIRIKGGIIFPILLILQFAMYYLQEQVPFFAHISGYFFMLVYVVGLYVLFLNRQEVGIWYIFIGVALNFLVMIVNGGRMPVSIEAASVLDPKYIQMLQDGAAVTKHFILNESTRLSFLGDIIPLSSPYPRTQVISIGDIIMNIGIFLYLQKVMIEQKLLSSSIEAQ